MLVVSWFTRYLTIKIGYKYISALLLVRTGDNNGNRYLEIPLTGPLEREKETRFDHKNCWNKSKGAKYMQIPFGWNGRFIGTSW